MTEVLLWIVSGPTSVGKSTFMTSSRCCEITGLPPEPPIIFPNTQERLDQLGTTDALYHYNILRPFDLKRHFEHRGAAREAASIRGATDFAGDPQWRNLFRRPGPKKAVVLVTSKRVILERSARREVIEDTKFAKIGRASYVSEQWLKLYEQVDLGALYRAWCRELRSRGIPYALVDSTDRDFPVIEDEGRLPRILAGDGPTYTEEQVKEILQERKFEYHRVELPYGLHTPGADRSETRDLVLPRSLKGKSVLDVGSALGYFCFEAEARGANRVVGVELKKTRLRDALLLKDIKGSQVEFIQQDIVSDPIDERFDLILLLNVIHHLAEPFRVMRQLASVTNERLVIEFPTFADSKFRKSVRLRLPPFLYNRLPLVGVSSMARADQTFVFTPSAIKRVLLDHERLFDEVDIVRSPMAGRVLAICRKGGKR